VVKSMQANDAATCMVRPVRPQSHTRKVVSLVVWTSATSTPLPSA
jgi:hypothetical protein